MKEYRPRILATILLCLMSSCLWAQKDSCYIRLVMRDAFTRESLKDITVTVMDTDSTVMARPQAMYSNAYEEYMYRFVVKRQPQYIIRAEGKRYETYCDVMEVKRRDGINIVRDIILHRAPIPLDEVTVTGSKVLMVVKGDTIIYHAAAFELSNGSMLDALVRQLPGVELHGGGRITVNGKFVSALLLNGRDFFNGDPKIALDNLPAYYVDKVKVYHRLDNRWRMRHANTTQLDTLKSPLVMDVILKHDHAEGWLGNAEAAQGTEQRRLARLFAMRYTRNAGLFIYGNANNLNNSQTANEDGSWAGRVSQQGEVKTQSYGISFSGKEKRSRTEYHTSAKVKLEDGDHEEVTSADNYYATGSVFQRTKQTSGYKNFNIDWDGSLYYPHPDLHLSFKPSVSYSRTDNHSLSYAASFSSAPNDAYRGASIDSLYSPLGSRRLTELLINRHERRVAGHYDDWRMNGYLGTAFYLLGKFTDISVKGDYQRWHGKPNEFNHMAYSPKAQLQEETTNRHTDQLNKEYDYEVKMSHDLREGQLSADLTCSYEQSLHSGNRHFYRLEAYDDYKDRLGVLPSTSDSLQAVIDLRNSYYSTVMHRQASATLVINWHKLHIQLPLSYKNDRLEDYRASNDAHVKRHSLNIDMEIEWWKKPWQARYSMTTTTPNLHHLVDVRDDSDPLNVYLGNAKLGNTHRHTLSIEYGQQKTERQRNVHLEYELNIMQGAVCMSRYYDMTTGKSTYLPDNINGNWHTSLGFSYGQQVDKKRRLSLSTSTNASYHHSVDYATIQTQGSTVMGHDRNTVNNIWSGETIKADYRKGALYAAATASLNWNHADSKTDNFKTVNAFNYNYGVTVTQRFTKRLDLYTEMMMWSRRGYTDRSMNDDELIWNLSLSYAIGRLNQWIVKAEGRDILRSQNSVRQTMNAQGRTETWYKTIPSYWILHLMYQFKKAPKKNQGI